jgi:L-histidine N-alpha-methyltransferase
MKPRTAAQSFQEAPLREEAHLAYFRIDRYLDVDHRSELAKDVRDGLLLEQKELPPKYFYDDVGSRLFDAICDTPEYYPTRTEYALLERISDEVVARTSPSHLVELGSGASRKTRLLLDALTSVRPGACYVPLDVSDGMLRSSATALRRAYPKLRIHGIVADYDRHLRHFPPAERRLVAFLGSTIGNFTPAEGVVFLRNLNDHLSERDFLFLGLDLVKPVDVLNAAYNDRQGITAEFNRNVLRVINRELQANFRIDLFEHVAFYREDVAQIEMHLRATEAHRVHVAALDLTVSFEAGETIRTEISRKFDRTSGNALLRGAGFEPERWFVSPDGYFALVLAGVARRD